MRWLVFLCACGGASHEVTAAFRVERVTQTKDGRDVDDASPEVTLVVGRQTVSAGVAFGQCGPLEHAASPTIRDTCAANAPAGTVITLGCGADPHVDRIACVYGVRSKGAVELWRQDFDYRVDDGVPPVLTAHAKARGGAIPVDATTSVRGGDTQVRDVAR